MPYPGTYKDNPAPEFRGYFLCDRAMQRLPHATRLNCVSDPRCPAFISRADKSRNPNHWAWTLEAQDENLSLGSLSLLLDALLAESTLRVHPQVPLIARSDLGMVLPLEAYPAKLGILD
ncbi:hypothetical protein CLAIMM_14354, partial [Cladophialophora immunda]